MRDTPALTGNPTLLRRAASNRKGISGPTRLRRREIRTMQNVRAATLAVLLTVSAPPVVAEGNAIALLLNDASQVRPRNVTVEAVRYGGSEALGVRQTGPYRG